MFGDWLPSVRGGKASYRMIKPFWDVIIDYLGYIMLLLSVIIAVVDLGLDKTFCVPAVACAAKSPDELCANAGTNDSVLRLEQKYQNDFVNSHCSNEMQRKLGLQLGLYLFIQALILIVCQNVWLMNPLISSRVETFLSLVMECYHLPGTIEAVVGSLVQPYNRRRQSTVPDDQGIAYVQVTEQTEADAKMGAVKRAELRFTGGQLDDIEMMKVKTLAEKLRMFRDTSGNQTRWGNFRWIYVFKSLSLVCYSSWYLYAILNTYYQVDSSFMCSPPSGYEIDHHFICSKNMTDFVNVLVRLWFLLLVPYLLTTVTALIWSICVLMYGRYRWTKNLPKIIEICDIQDSRGDLAFLLHLLQQCNSPLHVARFGLFLCESNIKLLDEAILERQWPLCELKRRTDDGGRTLKLTDLDAVPRTVFQLHDLDVLKFQNCRLPTECFKFERDTKTGTTFCKLSLRKLIMNECNLNDIPAEIFSMTSLSELNLSDNSIKTVPESIENLINLETLNLSNNCLETVDPAITNLQHLAILNIEGNPNPTDLPFEFLVNLPSLYLDESALSDAPAGLEPRLRQAVVRSNAAIPGGAVIKYDPKKAPHIATLLRKGRIPVYPMMSRSKGLMLVINNSNFNGDLLCRQGSETDVRQIQQVFGEIGYEVRVENDVNSDEFVAKISQVLALHQYHNCDSFGMFVLSHGDNDTIYGSDCESITIQIMIDTVTSFPHLNGKPKLFFIQACRGTSQLRHLNVAATEHQHMPLAQASTDAVPLSNIQPLLETLPCNDMIISYSTTAGYVSWRNVFRGSWYVSAITEVFAKHAWEEDVLNLLSMVNNEVSRKYKTPEEYRQIPAPVHMLTKKLYLLPGYHGGNLS